LHQTKQKNDEIHIGQSFDNNQQALINSTGLLALKFPAVDFRDVRDGACRYKGRYLLKIKEKHL
jgi:hypothetical protein